MIVLGVLAYLCVGISMGALALYFEPLHDESWVGVVAGAILFWPAVFPVALIFFLLRRVNDAGKRRERE